MIQMKNLTASESGLNFDFEPNVSRRPSGSENRRVSANNSTVVRNPFKSDSVTSVNCPILFYQCVFESVFFREIGDFTALFQIGEDCVDFFGNITSAAECD